MTTTAPTIRRPVRVLRPWVSAMWLSQASSMSESVLPAGRALLVVALGPVIVGATLHGPASRVREVAVEPGVYLGVQFRAGGTRAFFDVPAGELADRSVPLVELWGALDQRKGAISDKVM